MEQKPEKKLSYFAKENWPTWRKVWFFSSITPLVIGLLVAAHFGWHGRTVNIEGEELLEKLAAAQKVYHAKYNTFYNIGETPVNYDSVLNVDARKNKYFPTFIVTSDGNTFALRIDGNPKKSYAKDRRFIATGNKDSLEAFSFFMDSPPRPENYIKY
jgi:hypothetical protein